MLTGAGRQDPGARARSRIATWRGAPARSEVAEVEVESVAFIVCDALGLDTSGLQLRLRRPLVRWSHRFMKDTAERVIRCAKQILEGMEVDVSNDAGMEVKAS